MDNRLKGKKIALKWKIFIYLFVFTGILIGILWVLQTVYLDDFYKYIKMKELSNAVKYVEDNIDNEDIESSLRYAAKTYDVCYIISDINGKIVYSAGSEEECTVHYLTDLQRQVYFKKTVTNGGFLTVSSNDISTNMYDVIDKENGDSLFGDDIWNDRHGNESNSGRQDNPYYFDEFGGFMPRRNMLLEGVIEMKILKTDTGGRLLLMVNSIITPVDATVYTIRVQLIFISVILVLLALLMATFLSMRISKSISKLNNGAKELAKGNFDIQFEGKDYREVSELAETLNYAAAELGRAEGLQKELLANVSHDLRTPLTMITAYSEVLRDLPGENTPENVQVIIDEAKRLTLLVNDLLDISKLQAGVTNIQMREYDLTESIKAVIDRYAKLVEQDGYKIEFRYSDNVLVSADEFKIYQVVYNLINNAINYTGDDKSVIVKQIVNGGMVRIEVTDTGAGIPKEELANVWERYYKIDKNHKRAVMGTGLGLSIVNNILKSHNAKHGVESEVGKGSTFWFEMEIIRKQIQ